ncbi:zinc transporter ZupT [Corynebacterium pseudopelargi]|uniref:zinc transporter ZupT n=1 Tax=Corynebacterium pseudopelargi TaxID=2080757 RepID=UPI001FEB2ADE|nr:zinc transporter ZupT [Corynebacterium pseudopelargi]
MPDSVLQAFALTLFAGLSTGLGAAIAVARKKPTERFLAFTLGFSAGVMLYVSFIEILPEGFEKLQEAMGKRPGAWAAVAAFFGGIVLIGIIDRLVPEPVNPHEPGNLESKRRSKMMQMGVLTALAIAIHNFPEGFATFLAGLEDLQVALPVAVAIAIHNIPEGIAVAVPIREATGSKAKGFWLGLASGLAEPLGAVVGYLLLLPLIGPATLGVAFAAIAGIMVFISLDELLPTAVSTGKHHAAIYGLILGMAVMAISLLLFI